MRLTCKDKLEWSTRTNQAFQNLKTTFTMESILIHPNFSKPFFLESDAYDYALGAILSQNGEDRRLYTVYKIVLHQLVGHVL